MILPIKVTPSVATSHRNVRHRRLHNAHQEQSSNAMKEADGVAASEPDVDELRNARTEYYSKKSAERRKSHVTASRHTSSKKSVTSRSSKGDGEASAKVHGARRKHRSSRHRQAETAEGEQDMSEYVYGGAAGSASKTSEEMPQEEERPSAIQGRRRSTTSHHRSRREGGGTREDISSNSVRAKDEKSRTSSRTVGIDDLPTIPEVVVASTTKKTQEKGERASTKARPPLTGARPALVRSRTTPSAWRSSTTKVSKVVSVSSPSEQIDDDAATATPSMATDRRKASGLFSNRSIPVKPEVRVECLTCAEEVLKSKAAVLRCEHIMCHDCLIRIFNLSITDPQHMPPKCCTKEHIPLHHVDKLFNDKFKREWNRKYQEYTTRDRIYCPGKTCGEWIKPKYFGTDRATGRKFAKCKYCNNKVCTRCNGKWHLRRECPNDPALNEFIEMAKKSGWQKCFNCKAMVELKEGCNHMTCRCTAEFCMICGAKWKTCDCPWFNYEQGQQGGGQGPFPGLNFENIIRGIPVMFRHEFIRRGQQQPIQPEPAYGENDRGELPDPRRAFGYQQELDARRRQEQADEELARRMQFGLGLGEDRPNMELNNLHQYVVGGAVHHMMHDDNMRNLAAGAFNVALGIGQRIADDLLNDYSGGRDRRRTRGLARDTGRPIRRRASERDVPQVLVQANVEPLHPRSRDLSPVDLHRYDATRRGAADMAGLASPEARGKDRVGGWLEHVPENPADDYIL